MIHVLRPVVTLTLALLLLPFLGFPPEVSLSLINNRNEAEGMRPAVVMSLESSVNALKPKPTTVPNKSEDHEHKAHTDSPDSNATTEKENDEESSSGDVVRIILIVIGAIVLVVGLFIVASYYCSRTKSGTHDAPRYTPATVALFPRAYQPRQP